MRTQERVSISAFVDPHDHELLVERARASERSVSAEIRVALREHLRDELRRGAAVSAAAVASSEDER